MNTLIKYGSLILLSSLQLNLYASVDYHQDFLNEKFALALCLEQSVDNGITAVTISPVSEDHVLRQGTATIAKGMCEGREYQADGGSLWGLGTTYMKVNVHYVQIAGSSSIPDSQLVFFVWHNAENNYLNMWAENGVPRTIKMHSQADPNTVVSNLDNPPRNLIVHARSVFRVHFH
jgi:hypothetical protein